MTSSAKVQTPGKGINDVGLKASNNMRGGVNQSSLERGYLDAVFIASTEFHAPEKGVNDAGPNASAVVQAPGKGSQEAILEALRVILGDIDGYEVSKVYSSGCSTHIVRLSDPVNDGLFVTQILNSLMKGLHDQLLDSNYPVTGVDKGQNCKEKCEIEC